MEYIDEHKVNAAIRDCLRRCVQSSDVLAQIESFLLVLKAKGTWREAELREVETHVRKMLYGILDGATYPHDATSDPVGRNAANASQSPKLSRA